MGPSRPALRHRGDHRFAQTTPPGRLLQDPFPEHQDGRCRGFHRRSASKAGEETDRGLGWMERSPIRGSKPPEAVSENAPILVAAALRPSLNPVEQIWAHTKYGDLANFIPEDLDHLERETWLSLRAKHYHTDLIRSFFKHARLSIH
ncbi:MAG: hypothetical protein UZ03_NOB001003540 [Nitrospira sp. OLB3]|nr:MAG: hypothetical protein UZ03_NOB001003540 [Nitrospira sp. OLB3]